MEKFPKEPIRADPRNYSLRDEALDLELLGTETQFPIEYKGVEKKNSIYINRATGEKFYKIRPDKVPDQQLLSLILKSVVNVSDVVKVGDDYYSHKQNFDFIEPSEEKDIIPEVYADIFILTDLFRDNDHIYYPADNADRVEMERKQSNSLLHHHNLLVDERNRKSNFFDFAGPMYSGSWLHKMKRTGNTPPYLKQKFNQSIDNKLGLNPHKYAILSILRKKVQILINLYKDAFKTFKKQMQKSGVDLNEEEQRVVFDNIQLRLQALNEALSEIK